MAEEKTRDERFLSAFMSVWEIFKSDKSPSDLLINAYNDALSSFDIESVERVFGMAIATLKWFPRPAELIELIDDKPKIRIEAVAQQQWRLVLATLGKGDFNDPVTARLCKRQFNYNYLRNMLEKDENWEQKRFCEAYELEAEANQSYPQIEDMPEKVKTLAQGMLKEA